MNIKWKLYTFHSIGLVVCALVIVRPLVAGATFPVPEPQADTTNQSIQSLERGREAFRTGNYEAAERELKLALEVKKGLPEANVLLAWIYRNKGESGKAFGYAREAIKQDQMCAECHYVLAHLLFDRGDLHKARQEANLAIGYDANLALACTLIGNIEMSQQKFQSAVQWYERALGLSSADQKGRARLQEQVEFIKKCTATQARGAAKEAQIGKADTCQDCKAPVLIKSTMLPPPSYTDEAVRRGVQGTVLVCANIDEQGNVVATLLLSRLGFGLDQRAEECVRRYKFSPATNGGKPVATSAIVEISFTVVGR